jgi:hypothetical protein
MHIGTININLHNGQPSMARAFLEALLRAPELNKGSEAGDAAPATPPAASTTPKIGEHWIGQGGIYAGVARGLEGAPDYHLILSTEVPANDFEWQAALDHAKTISADGHSDFSVPTRFESALLYANLQDSMVTDYWHWTSTQYSETNAWVQYFGDGHQSSGSKAVERRCRFVRRSIL